MTFKLPIASANDGHNVPTGNRCTHCAASLTDGSDYSAFILSGGAMVTTADRRIGHGDQRLGGYLSFDTLCVKNGHQSSSQNLVIEDLHGGQFSITWCSASCMAEWLTEIVQRMDTQLSQEAHEA